MTRREMPFPVESLTCGVILAAMPSPRSESAQGDYSPSEHFVSVNNMCQKATSVGIGGRE
jgi:hypothetical protein